MYSKTPCDSAASNKSRTKPRRWCRKELMYTKKNQVIVQQAINVNKTPVLMIQGTNAQQNAHVSAASN